MEPSSIEASPDRALAAAFAIQQLYRKMTKSTPFHGSTAAKASLSSATSADSFRETQRDPHEHLRRPEIERGTYLYLAYGSNLSNETFRGNRGIKPLSQVNVQVPSLKLTFDLPGIPYAEPCFANSGSRDAEHDDPHSPAAFDVNNEKTPLLRQDKENGGYRKDRWHKGLIGVVYEVTQEDYTHIIATEGGGASYHDVLVDCHPFVTADPNAPVPDNPTLPAFKAHTLFAPAAPPGQPPKHGGRFQRSDPGYAQPSARYLKLITDGAAELGLPLEYQDYLHAIRPYTITSAKQRVGQYVFLAIWLPIVSFIFMTGKMFQDENGRLPRWMVELSGAIFKGVWASYDSFFEPMFGDGERSIPDGGDDVDGGDENAREAGSRFSRMLHGEARSIDVEKGYAAQGLIESYQSKTVINVSEDAHTSPSVDKSPVADADDERVEDSLNEHRRTNTGGPVQSPRQPAEDSEEDDLYGLSPQGKASIAAANLVKKDRANTSAPPPGSTVDGHWSQQPAVEIALHEEVTGSAPHGSLVNDATTHSRSAAFSKRVETDELHTEPHKQLLVGAQHSKKHPSATGPYANTRTAACRTSMVPVGTSALDALRAKKEALAVARTGGETVQASRNRSPAASLAQDRSPKRLPLKERSRNVPTPAKTKPGAATAAQKATDDKPKSRKLGMFAQTPVGGREKSVQGAQKRKGAKAGARDEWDDDGAFEPSKKGKVAQRSTPGTLKRPTLSAKSRGPASIGKPTYDMPESPPLHIETTTMSKRGGTAKKPAPAKRETSKASKWRGAAEDEHVETAGKGRPRKLAKLSDSNNFSELEIRKQPARQAKVLNGAAGSRIGEVEEADEPALDKPLAASATIKDAKHVSTKIAGRGIDETIEDFEYAVVTYDDDNKLAAGDRDIQQGSLRATARNTVQNPQVKTHTDLNNEQRDSHGVSKQSKHDTDRVGGSQANAITLSDRLDPSSSVLSTPEITRPAAATLAQVRPSATEGRRAPQTPAVFHSSPPLNNAQGTHQPPTGLLEHAESHRTTIISFGRSGPRNQGTRSAKKSVIGSARTDRTQKRRSKGRSSPAATSTKSYRTDRTAMPNNVAEDVGDALAGFLKIPANLSGKSVAPDKTQAAFLHAQSQASRPIAPLRPPTDITDDSWTYVEDAIDGREPQVRATVPAQGGKPLKKPLVDRTASQLAMPPPALELGSTVKSGQATASSAVRRKAAVGQTASVDKEGGKAATKPSVKRSYEQDSFSHPAPKKSKRIALDTQRTQAAADHPAAIPQAKVTLPEHVPTREPEPRKRAERKISRHASQGVDINGSPIPKNMVVPENATTLETYTQHAGLSPDQRLPASDTAVRRTMTDSPTNPTFFEEMLAVPSHQVKILASNEKRKPASPREDSQAITGVVLGKVNAKQLVMRDGGVPPPTDPFLSSESLRKVPKGPSSSSLFSEELRTRAEQIANKRRHAALADEEEDPDKTLVQPAPASKRLNGNPTSKRLRAAFADEDDPDQTLVEPEPRPKRPKGNATNTRKNASAISAADKENTADMPVIGLWRDALRPHQLNLFDELVAVSHRLVRHLVDHETALHEAVYDYQRRGLNIIEQAELVRAQDYEKSLKQLAREKEAVRQGLRQQSERMRGAMERVLQMKAERSKTDVLLLAEQARLEEMLAQLGGV
ncbi:hypothetical protein LTR91_024709 [Friedmanniomyces endolithicus]|uniref:gamma-glutamylcyclotransferase n=1 Tax=Friedmanniomyces endolithicus TaxID=329885 RepID=A0AAN6H1M4_9PEZI|nr:hypothetical protein LTR75_016292 [Friedmanniomyces endolithicus]KAK0893982.1 hypothetical protein LTR57_023737 [Friedmanniomyces endolithicus]KAK0951926.1 hypothetical protein LTR91_024709 [Friedmanniomyces endolithicus]